MWCLCAVVVVAVVLTLTMFFVFPEGENFITINFIPFSYISSCSLKFSYKLEVRYA